MSNFFQQTAQTRAFQTAEPVIPIPVAHIQSHTIRTVAQSAEKSV